MTRRPVQIHVPKTGGLSVRIYLRSVTGHGVTATSFHPTINNPILLKWADKLEAEGEEPYLFAFVREPIERLISSYTFTISRLAEKHRVTGNKVFWHRRSIRKLLFMPPEQEGPPTVDQFFAAILEHNRRFLNRLGPWGYMFHPQSKWCLQKKNGRKRKLNLYDFGDMKDEMTSLLSECGYADPGVGFIRVHSTSNKPELSPILRDKLTQRYEKDFIVHTEMLMQKQMRRGKLKAE